jgi:hypothetical protein
MPKSYNDVYAEFSEFKKLNPNDSTELPDFARQMDMLDGAPERAEAYDASRWKRANAAIDRAFNYTPVPSVLASPAEVGAGFGGLVGEAVDTLAGTHVQSTLEDVGRATPRMVAEGIATAPLGGAGAWARGLGAAGKVAGYGSAFTRGVAESGDDSLLGGAISAGSLGLGNYAIPAAGSAAERGLARLLERNVPDYIPEVGLAAAPTALRKGLGGVANVAGGAAAATGINEATRQGMLSVMPDEMRTEGDRNPFTQENIAGNVAGTAFFLPQLITSLMKGGPKVSPKQVGQMLEQQAVTAAAEPTNLGDMTPPPSTGNSRQDALLGILEQSVENRKLYAEDGRVDEVARLDSTIEEAYNEMMSGKYGTADAEQQNRVKAAVDDIVKFQPPDSSEKFAELANMIKSNLDTFTNNKDVFQQELKVREDNLNWADKAAVAKHEAWKAEQLALAKPGPKQSWHPEARASQVLDRLWKSGDAPALSEDWMKSEWNATFDESGNPQFSNAVLAQKMANYFADKMPENLAKAATRKADTSGDRISGQLAPAEKAFIARLSDIPKQHLRPILQRTGVISGEERVDARSGQSVTRTKKWHEDIERAFRPGSYDPVTDTILLPYPGKPGEGPVWKRVPAKTAYEKTGERYAWSPSERRIPRSEGGKPVGVQSLDEPSPVTDKPMDIGDEEAFKRALAEQSEMPFGEKTDISLDETNRLQDPSLDVVDEASLKAETAISEKMAEKEGKLRENLARLTDEQLWRLAEPLFPLKMQSKINEKRAGLRLALTAALEQFKATKGQLSPAGQKFLDAQRAAGSTFSKNAGPVEDVKVFLRSFFMGKVPVEGGGTKLPYNVQRLGALVAKLLDEKTIARVKSEGPSVKFQEGQQDEPLVRFSGPVRLQKWLDGRYKVGVTPNAIGQIPTKSVPGLLQKLGISGDEMALYKAAGLDELLKAPQVKVNGLVSWMQEKTPKVEVKKLEPKQPLGEKQHELDRAVHRLETQGFRVERNPMDESVEIYEPHTYGGKLIEDVDSLSKDYGERTLKDINEIISGNDFFAEGAESDAATGRYGVEPKELKDMPGAVDILVRVPVTERDPNPNHQKNPGGALMYRGPHFGDSDKNVLASVRGYVETLPSGEKVFHVFEVQSDWGQSAAKFRPALRQLDDVKFVATPKSVDAGGNQKYGPNGEEHGWYAMSDTGNRLGQGWTKEAALADAKASMQRRGVNDHPLLAVYEQLALKAAIDHARKLGIKKVAISDAETAMMTEGHDRIYDDDVRLDPNPNKEIPRPKQEPGMRAAYDARLPRTMEKLTGGRGEVVDFGTNKNSEATMGLTSTDPDYGNGSPVFKGQDGKGKTSVTARLYDITSAPDQFAAFGYGKPQVGVEGASPDAGNDLLNPRPVPGQFVEDVTRTLRTRIDTLLGRVGYSGTTKAFYTELAVALAKQNAIPDLDFYRVQGDKSGLAGLASDKAPSLGVNVDTPVTPGSEAKATLALLQTLGHEIGHLDGFIRDGLIAKPDAYSKERGRLKQNFESLATSLTDDERQAMLTVIQEYLPPALRTNRTQPDGRPYGTSSPDEFAQEIESHAMQMLAHDTVPGRAAAADMMSYLPTEVRELYRDTFRTAKDIMQTMRDAAVDYQARVDAGEANVMTENVNPFVLTRGFETLIDTARNFSTLRYADKAMADARAWTTNFDKAPNTEMTQSIWYTKGNMPMAARAQVSMPNEPTQTSIEAVTHARDFLNGPRAKDKAARLGIVGRFLAPFRAEMWAMERNGNKMARPIADTIFELEPGSHRILSSLLTDYMVRAPDGSVKFDSDNPLIKRVAVERTGPWRDAVNKISKWQQEVHELADGKGKLDAQSLFVKNEKGELVANPNLKGAEEFWNKTRAGLSKEDQQFVASQSFILDQLGVRARDTITTSIAESNVNRATALVMATNKGMNFDTASRLAKAAHDGFLAGNVLSLQGTIPPPQLEMLQRLFLGPDGKSGLIRNYLDVVKHFENRPGYRSESLPHDWIVRFRDKTGKTKFDSRPTEGQAQALARELQSKGNVIDGEIVNKSDARQFNAADDPDGILTKVTEREGFIWGKFVEEMTQKHGGAFGQELQSGYTPLESTMRDVSSAGVGKYLKERQGFVDRDSFDYIDSSMAYAERLAYSVAVRSMKQRVELLLNDPSVRLQTSFRNLVQGHMQEMLRPQSQVMKELKGITSGMFIAGNLSSTIVNAMQSMQTLVPVLDLMNGDKGNFVTPWKQLGRAIADATDFSLGHNWKDLAGQTKRIPDATKWSEDQTVAELWRRHVEAGGFTHTVADDVAYGQDQRLLTNAKFGRGDYGPVTRASMLRSAVYLGNQYAMLPFRTVERVNSKVAFLAGARQAYSQGLRGDAAYAKAAQVQGLATFGGGRANSTGLQTTLSKGFTPGGAGLALALQQYGFGVVAMHGQFVRDSLGLSKGLSQAEVWHARRAYGTFLMTQTALAGVLGLPLVGATLTALEKVFGIPANQAVRQGLASLAEDDETGATVAEIGLNGLADYWTGLDVSSRLGTSSLLGTSSYRGFNWGDLAGPTGSLLASGVESLGYFGQGQPMKAATSLAPTALKKALEMTDSKLKYGDVGFRDKAGNLLYLPTENQAKAYAFGFRPRELSRRRQLQSALATADELTQVSRDREFDLAAQDVLRGDNTRTQLLQAQALDADPINGSQTALRAIMDRAIGATTEKDLLATGSRYNQEDRSRIYKTFGPDVQHRRSEVELQDLRLQLASALGDPRIAPNAQAYKQAAVIDALIQGGAMPRSEAVQIVQMLGL